MLPAAAELVRRVRWLLELRWVAVVVSCGGLVGLGVLSPGTFALVPLLAVTVVLVVHSVLLTWALRQRGGEPGPPDARSGTERALSSAALAPAVLLDMALSALASLRRAAGPERDRVRSFLLPEGLKGLAGEREAERAAVLACAQIGVDLLALAALTHYSGGIESPLLFFFVFHVVISGTLLSRRATFLNTGVAFSLAGAVGAGELLGWLPHHPLPVLGQHGGHQAPGFVAVQLLVLGATLFLTAHMASSIVSHTRGYEREAALLAQRLSARADEIEEAWTRVSDAERLKAVYMRRVAHELKAPLATIQSVLQVVLGGHAGEITEKTRDMVERAERRAGELAHVTQDLLTLTRARDGQAVAERAPVDLGELAADVVADLLPLAEAAGLTLSLVRPPDSGHGRPIEGRLIGEPAALRQLVLNLVGNAIRYSRPGGRVAVRVSTPAPGMVQMEVEDAGIGIPASDLPRVFDEFYRSANAKLHVAGGTGLGLAIVKAVAEQHGGEVKVHSAVGEGTCFTVRLPLRD